MFGKGFISKVFAGLVLVLCLATLFCVAALAATDLPAAGGTLTDGEYILNSDVDLESNITVDGDVTIDLNGHVLKGTGSGWVIKINADAKLTVKDGAVESNPSATPGSITGGGSSSVSSGGGIFNNGGELVISSGMITGNKASYGGGVYNQGKFTLSGSAIISGNSATSTSNGGGGVYNSGTGTFTMTGGTISDNTSNYYGGGVQSTGTFNMSGTATIKGNSGTAGGGVYTSGTFTMTDGTIEGNKAHAGNGGAVCIAGGTFNMSGGRLAYNTATQNGGAVRITSSGTFNATGGTITCNSCASGSYYGGAIHLNSGKCTVGGTVQITGNVKGGTVTNNSGVYSLSGGTEQNVYLPSGKTVTVSTDTPPVTTGVNPMQVGVTAATAPTLSAPTALTGTNGTNYSAGFISDNANYYIANESNVVKLLEPDPWKALQNAVSGKDAAPAWEIYFTVSDNTTTGVRTITLKQDIVCTDQSLGPIELVANKPIIIDLAGYAINRNLTAAKANGNVMWVPSNADLTIQDSSTAESGKITGGYTTNTEYTYPGCTGGISVYYGKLTFEGGTVCGNRTKNKSGGGIYIYHGTLEMRGNATVSGNSASAYAGGVLASAGSTMVMEGDSKIINNKAKYGGGLDTGATLTIQGNALIAGNEATASGGGIYLEGSGTCTLKGDVNIAENKAATNGGGIFYTGSSKLVVGGSVNVTGNTQGSATNNIYINNGSSNKTITVDTVNAPTGDMKLGITSSKAPTLSSPISVTGTNSTDYSSSFSSDNTAYAIKNVNNVVKLMLPGTVTNSTPEADKATNHGFITVNKTVACAGDTVSVTAVTPDTAYVLDQLIYNDGTDHDITAAKGFTMPAANVTVKATFKHEHDLIYAVNSTNPAQLTVTCDIAGCPDDYDDTPRTLTLTAPTDLTYTGSAKTVTYASGEADQWLAVTGVAAPTVTYTAKSGSALTSGLPVNVGEYTASSKVNDTTVATLDFAITPGASAVTVAPVANTLTYNGADQALTTAGTAENGVMNYALGTDASTAPTDRWGTQISTGKEAGTYYVWYKSVGNANYTDTAPACVTVTVSKATVTVSGITANDRGYVPGDKTVALNTSGMLLDGKVTGDDLSATVSGEMADDAAGDGKKVTLLNLALTGADVDNYVLAATGNQTETTVNILKDMSAVTVAPVANTLTYNGADQALTTAGSAQNGVMNYALGTDASTAPTDGWGTSIATGKEAGTYYVWYKSVGNTNYADTVPVCVTVTVSKATVTVSGITATDRGYVPNDVTVTLNTADAVLNGKVTGDDLSVTGSGEMADDAVGNGKKVTLLNLALTGAAADNYVLAATGNQTETTVNILEAMSAVTVAPVANTLTYNGADQALTTAGSAENGVMNYALGTDASTTPTDGWGTQIPTGKEVGTYYVWYKSVGNVNYADSTPVCVTVTITKLDIPVTKVILSDETLPLKPGESQKIVATVQPADATDPTLTWTADAEGIIEIQPDGTVSALKPGTVKVTVKASNGVYATCTVTVNPIEYEIIRGAGQTIPLDTTEATFASNADYGKFMEVEVDGVKVDKSAYDSYSGSTVIVLKPRFIKTLKVGKHTLEIISSDGRAKTFFFITKPMPPTGDSTNMALLVLLLISSLVTAGFLMKRQRGGTR